MSKKIGNIISTIIFVVLITLVTIFVAPKLFGYTPMVVLSGSMEPSYPVGSLIYANDVETADLQKNDIITFYLGNTQTIVTHRVVSNDTEKQEIITKGDANVSEDGSPVAYSRVIGKASSFAIPMLGYIAAFMNTTAGYICIGTLILAIIIISFITDDKSKGKEKDGNK